jgi:hypothetical protein
MADTVKSLPSHEMYLAKHCRHKPQSWSS